MKPTKQILEQKIEDVLSYLLCHNMADMSVPEFWKLTNAIHVLETMADNSGIKSYPRGTYLDSIRPIR